MKSQSGNGSKGEIYQVFFDSAQANQYYCAPMSEGTQSKSIPRVIDPRKFAQHGVKIQGNIPPQELTRLAAACVSVGGVDANLSFATDGGREKIVTGEVDAVIEVQCQRCLDPVELTLTCEVNLALAWSEDSAKQIADGYDPWIVEEDEADLYSVLEEEILLNMPYVAYHEHQCVSSELLGQVLDSQDPDLELPETQNTNPFHVLKQLKEKPKN